MDKLHSVLTLEQVFMDELAVYKCILGLEDEHLLLLEGGEVRRNASLPSMCAPTSSRTVKVDNSRESITTTAQ